MIKYFCDLCGAEITEAAYKKDLLFIELRHGADNFATMQTEFEYIHFCDNCKSSPEEIKKTLSIIATKGV